MKMKNYLDDKIHNTYFNARIFKRKRKKNSIKNIVTSKQMENGTHLHTLH